MKIKITEEGKARGEVWVDAGGQLQISSSAFKPWMDQASKLGAGDRCFFNGYSVAMMPPRDATLRHLVHLATVLATRYTGKYWQYKVDGPLEEVNGPHDPPYY